MRAFVIYESMFGNTRDVARAVGEGLADHGQVDVVEVGAAQGHLPEVDLLVVGGPTHAFSMTRPSTREDAARKMDGEPVSTAGGIREWLESAAKARPGVVAAAFDTKIDKPFLPGSAARAAEKRLRKLGYRIVVGAENFLVADTPGPLDQGEIERARVWGSTLGALVASEVNARSRI